MTAIKRGPTTIVPSFAGQPTRPIPFVIEPDAVPLRIDESGAVRVGNSQVLLEIVIHAYETGARPEEIVERFDTLQPADVYATIGYYLRHQEAVADYIRQVDEEGERLRQEWEARYPAPGLKERLLARHTAMQAAAAGDQLGVADAADD